MDLRLAAKVITVNTLIASQFIYKLSCLDSPSDEHYKKYKSVVRDNLCNGKTPKIAYDTLISSPKTGGLKLVHLSKKDSAMKIQWIKHIKNNEAVAELPSYFLPAVVM